MDQSRLPLNPMHSVTFWRNTPEDSGQSYLRAELEGLVEPVEDATAWQCSSAAFSFVKRKMVFYVSESYYSSDLQAILSAWPSMFRMTPSKANEEIWFKN